MQLNKPHQNFYSQLPYDRRVGINIKIRRSDLRLTQTELAEKLNWGREIVTKIETGVRPVSVEELDRISEVLQCHPLQLMPEKINNPQEFS